MSEKWTIDWHQPKQVWGIDSNVWRESPTSVWPSGVGRPGQPSRWRHLAASCGGLRFGTRSGGSVLQGHGGAWAVPVHASCWARSERQWRHQLHQDVLLILQVLGSDQLSVSQPWNGLVSQLRVPPRALQYEPVNKIVNTVIKHFIYQWEHVLSSQPRVTVTWCFVYKVIRVL